MSENLNHTPTSDSPSQLDTPDIHQESRVILRTYIISAIFLIITLVGSILNFGEFAAWQILADSAGVFASLIIIAISFWHYRQGKTDRAIRMIPAAIILAYAPGDLFLEGVTLYNLISGLLLFLIGFAIFKPRSGAHWWRMAALHAGLVLLFGSLTPLPQFDVANSSSWQASLPVTTSALALLLLIQLAFTYRVTSIQNRLLIILVSIGLLPTLISSVFSLGINFNQDTEQAANYLEAVASLKDEQISNWVLLIEEDLQNLENDAIFLSNVEFLFRFTPTENYRNQITREMLESLTNLATVSQRYDQLSLVSETGDILLTTNPELLGTNIGNQPDFLFGLDSTYFSTPSVDPETGEATARVFNPLTNSQGLLLAVLYGELNPESVLASLTDPRQLGETGEAYLVSSSNQLITPLRNSSEIQPGTYQLESIAITSVLRTYQDNNFQYSNYAGVDVIGVQRWIPEIKAALIVEQTRDEAFQALRLNLIITAGIALITLGVTITFAIITAQNFSNPIQDLSNKAALVWQGALERIDPIVRSDEIGELSTTLSLMTSRLAETTTNLEQTVAERTQVLERRARYLETTSQISRAVTTIYDLSILLNTTTQLISENFGFYHVGIFILDDRNEFAVLRAANSEGGWRMLARDHKLRVGEQGIVGYVTGSGKPRVQQQVTGEDSVYFSNPDLPQTRSEMALPLKVGTEIFGALDVQSTQEQAFTDEDIAVLQVLADSVAVAIQNTRLIQQLQDSLESERRIYGEITRDAWTSMLSRAKRPYAVRSDRTGTQLITEPVTSFGRQALAQAKTIIGELDDARSIYPIAIPVFVRGGTPIAVIETSKSSIEGPWARDEITILETVCTELGLALDNARLFEDTQMKAQRDRLAADLAAKIWSSSDVENILQTAVHELGSALQVSHGTIRLSLPEEDGADPADNGANQS
jgi:GAF domain-containing protein